MSSLPTPSKRVNMETLLQSCNSLQTHALMSPDVCPICQTSKNACVLTGHVRQEHVAQHVHFRGESMEPVANETDQKRRINSPARIATNEFILIKRPTFILKRPDTLWQHVGDRNCPSSELVLIIFRPIQP
jgi:hypothetical protein